MFVLFQVKPAPPPVEKKYGPAAKEARRKEKEEREKHRVLEKQKADEEARQAKPPLYVHAKSSKCALRLSFSSTWISW